MDTVSNPGHRVDPVVARRRLIAVWCGRGRTFGYVSYLVALVLFFVGMWRGFDDLIVAVLVGAMVVGGVVLIPSIILGYAVKAADREDRERGLDPD